MISDNFATSGVGVQIMPIEYQMIQYTATISITVISIMPKKPDSGSETTKKLNKLPKLPRRFNSENCIPFLLGTKMK